MGLPPLATGRPRSRGWLRFPEIPPVAGPVVPAAAVGLGVGALASAAMLAPARSGLASLIAVLSVAAVMLGVRRMLTYWQRSAHLHAHSHPLEERNHQLQALLQASRAMSSVLDLSQVLDTVVNQVAAHTRFEQSCVIMGPSEAGEFHVAAARGMSRNQLELYDQLLCSSMRAYTPAEWARLTLQPVIVEKVSDDFRTSPLRDLFARTGAQAFVAVPMVVQDRFVGVLTVYLGHPSPFSTAEVSFLAALATQAALAVENARLYTLSVSTQSRLDKAVEFLENVSSALTRTQVGVHPLLRLVAQAIAKLFEPASIYLCIQGENGQAPVDMAAHCGVDPEQASEYRRRLVNGANLADLPSPWPAALGFPIHVDGRRLGHIEIYLAGSGRKVDARERSILQAFVHLTASALGNAGLVHELRHAVQETERAYMGTLEALTRALEIRDHDTEGHSRRVVQYTLAIAQQLGLPEQQLVPLMRGALLHDIGKIGIPDGILRKPGSLTPEEWEIMRSHPRIGFAMLYPIDFLRDATPIILYHHERYDGTGYPDGLARASIPIGARIFAVADAYDALTSDRPYRRGKDHAAAVQEIVSCAGTQFDPAVVEALLAIPEQELARIRGLSLEVPAAAVSLERAEMG